MSIVVVDYGVGNIFSITKALEFIECDYILSGDPQTVINASHVILPGVGAFSECMSRLSQHDLVDTIKHVAAQDTPLLGICVGMQMMFDSSSEFGNCAGLGLIPGTVDQLPNKSIDGERLSVPNIGWRKLYRTSDKIGQNEIFTVDNFEEHYYFLHSFAVTNVQPECKYADFRFGGLPFAAAVRMRRTFGVQFHPEKSGPAGLNILKNFSQL